MSDDTHHKGSKAEAHGPDKGAREADIVLIPGNMCDASLWDGLRPALAAQGHRLIDADTSSDDSIAAMAARALNASPRPLIAVGFSMGGIIALDMLRQAPERLAGLVLIGTNPGADLPERAAARPQHQARVRAGALGVIIGEELMPVYLAPAHRNDAALNAHIIGMAMALGEEVFIRQSEALRQRSDNWPVLSRFARPALVTCGADDVLCPPAWHENMAQALPEGALSVIPESGHMLPLEQPEKLGAAISAYLARLEAMERAS